MRYFVILLLLVLGPTQALSRTLEQSLLMLEPEERAHQACIARGIDDLSRKKLHVDRLKSSIFSRAAFDGTTVTAEGGAYRAKGRWYRLAFTCTVNGNQTKAVTFAYKLGPEIPRKEWQDLGLWQ